MAEIPQPRLIPHVISDRANKAPDSIWASIPLSLNDASTGYEDVTFARLNFAITRASHWLQDTVRDGTKLPGCKALAYMGPPDTRYIILTVAAIKTGYKVRLTVILHLSTAKFASLIFHRRCFSYLLAIATKPKSL